MKLQILNKTLPSSYISLPLFASSSSTEVAGSRKLKSVRDVLLRRVLFNVPVKKL